MDAPANDRRRCRRGTLARAVVVLALLAGGASALAPGADAGPAAASSKPRPSRPAPAPQLSAEAQAAKAAASCDLRDPDAPKDEFVGCVTAEVMLDDDQPDPGETTTATLTVRADIDVPGAVIGLGVNDRFELTSAPGFGRPVARPSGAGPLLGVSLTADLAAGSTRTWSVTVRATSAGTGVLQGTVAGPGPLDDAVDEHAVAVGGGTTLAAGNVSSTAPAAMPSGSGTLPPGARYHAVGVAGPAPAPAKSPGASCATGNWYYVNQLGQTKPSTNFQVQVWDQDPGGSDDLLAVAVTGAGGSYTICFESTDFDGGGGQEVYLRFVSANSGWRVRDTAASNLDYVFGTGVIAIGDPGTASFGGLQPGDNTLMRALHAFESLNDLFTWQAGVNGGCLDDPGQCRQVVLNWTSTSTDGTYYSGAGNDIHLAASNPDFEDVTVHEGAHALMDNLYDDDFPPYDCNPHNIFQAYSAECAWGEGWAEWVPVRVYSDSTFNLPDGNVDLEYQSWNDGRTRGDGVEGRVAGALLDLSDANNEYPWDRYSEATGWGAAQEPIYLTSRNDVSDTLAEFWFFDRPGEGDNGFLARTALFAATVDYGQRDPLFTDAELTRPTLSSVPTPHNYSYSTSLNYWSGVAIRPGVFADEDLRVYDTSGLTGLLATSSASGYAVDYVLVDGNHKAADDYYPQAYHYDGAATPYAVELSANSQQFLTGATTVSFAESDVIQVRDALVSAGVTNYLRVVPSSGLALDVLVHDSANDQAATWIQSRSSAIAADTGNTFGDVSSLTFVSPDNDYAAIVLANVFDNSDGTATVYRDATAPTGAVTIDGGAASTTQDQVTLSLSAADPETGILDMRVSTDGVLDSEAFEPFASSRSVTLPAGAGTKTVLVQYRDRAGAVATVSDTIERVVTCRNQVPTITGSGVIDGTGGDDVIVGSEGADTINGLGGNDTICGLGGDDVISDGPGGDDVLGGAGNDTFKQGAAADAGDVFDGGTEIDTVTYAARAADLDVSIDVNANDGAAGENDFARTTTENVTGGRGDDTLAGAGGANVLTGGAGDDTLRGLNGADTEDGGVGADTFDQGATPNGADVLIGGPDRDTVSYAARTARVTVTLNGAADDGAAGEGDTVVAGNEVVLAGSGNDTLTGSGAAETLNGGAGDDTLAGGAGVDTVLGGPGDDTINEGNGPSGADVLNGGADRDTIQYTLRGAAVKIILDALANDGASGEGDTVLGFEVALGGNGADTITGSGLPENLIGNGGNDTISGGNGADYLAGGAGADSLLGQGGNDDLFAVDGVSGNDTANGGAGTGDTADADAGDTVLGVP